MNMIRTWPAILLAASIATLSGCVQQPAVVETPASSQPAPQVVVVRAENEILAYALRYSALPAEDQRKEYAQVMQGYNHNKESLSNRIRAALVMALPGSRQRDNAKALALLDEIQREQSADQDARAIAALCASMSPSGKNWRKTRPSSRKRSRTSRSASSCCKARRMPCKFAQTRCNRSWMNSRTSKRP